MIRRDLLEGHWKPYLERAITLKPCYEGGINGGEVLVFFFSFFFFYSIRKCYIYILMAKNYGAMFLADLNDLNMENMRTVLTN